MIGPPDGVVVPELCAARRSTASTRDSLRRVRERFPAFRLDDALVACSIRARASRSRGLQPGDLKLAPALEPTRASASRWPTGYQMAAAFG